MLCFRGYKGTKKITDGCPLPPLNFLREYINTQKTSPARCASGMIAKWTLQLFQDGVEEITQLFLVCLSPIRSSVVVYAILHNQLADVRIGIDDVVGNGSTCPGV